MKSNMEKVLMPNLDDKKIFVIGSTGMLGSALSDKLLELSCDVEFASWPKKDGKSFLLDITNSKSLADSFERIKPDIVFNCSAYTDVDGAEGDYDTAYKINATGVENIAKLCKKNNSLLVHISTDYVFPGDADKPYTPDDPTEPVTAYGRSKFAGEKAIAQTGCEHIIIRTAWLFGPGGNNFVDTIIKLAKSRDEIKVVDDQLGCPTYTKQLADCMIALAASNGRGVFHFCNGLACSWYDFASEIVKLSGIDCKVLPCSSDEFPRPAKRPAYSVLDISKTTQTVEMSVMSWQEALKDYLNLLP